MASVIAGRGHGEGHAWGVSGVAPAATILSVRVTLDNNDPQRDRPHRVRTHWPGASATRPITAPRDQHVAGRRQRVLGGAAAEEKAVRYALDRGSVLVASAGNDGAGPNCKNFPAAYPGVIAVGAVDGRMRVAPFSNRQEYLSLVAPGVQIVSATVDGSYVIGDGTSSAAAIVAGVVALVRSEFPRLTPLRSAGPSNAAPPTPRRAGTVPSTATASSTPPTRWNRPPRPSGGRCAPRPHPRCPRPLPSSPVARRSAAPMSRAGSSAPRWSCSSSP